MGLGAGCQCCALLLFFSALDADLASARKFSGRASLGPGQAKVVAKFCFDFNPSCHDGTHCADPPGKLSFQVSGARLAQTTGLVLHEVKPPPKLSVALLDDEYFSFPEVSQVWGEANCTDVTRAAKRAYPLDWHRIASEEGLSLDTAVVEKLRPRWWFVALVSCSSHSLEIGYRFQMQNPLQGDNAQLSMDEIGIVPVCFFAFFGFAALAVLHTKSVLEWSERNGAPSGARILQAAALFGTLGHLAWLEFFRQYRSSGEVPETLALVARSCIITGKTLLQILLMLLAQGDCVCTPGISWSRRREMIGGMAVFGFLGLWLELWGDREASGSPIEYMYDTRPGVALIAIEMMWLYAYASRCLQTWSNETRIRPRHFYKRFASVLSLWFLTLPGVALLASVPSPWVRFRIVFGAGSFAHACVTGILIYVYHPQVAPDLFELKAKDREVAETEELRGFLSEPEGYFGSI